MISARTVGGLLAFAMVLYAVLVAFGFNDDGVGALIDVPLYTALEFSAALFCLARVVLRPNDRWPWLAVGLGIASFAIGDAYFSFVLVHQDPIPYPSLADAGYIGLYPLVYLGLGLLLRGRTLQENRSFWLDGVIAGLTVGALGAALLFSTIIDTTGGAALTVATNLAYPLGDLGLLVIVLATLGLTGWQIDRVWGCALAGCVLFAVTDTAYLYQTAQGTYVQSTVLDSGWPAGLLLFAFAAWQPKRVVVHRQLEGARMLAVPVGFGLLAVGLLVYDHFNRLNTTALVLSTLALLAESDVWR